MEIGSTDGRDGWTSSAINTIEESANNWINEWSERNEEQFTLFVAQQDEGERIPPQLVYFPISQTTTYGMFVAEVCSVIYVMLIELKLLILSAKRNLKWTFHIKPFQLLISIES